MTTLWTQAQALLDARCDPLGDVPFQHAFADAYGAALDAADEQALAELEALTHMLAALRELPRTRPAAAPQRRVPLYALGAGLAATLLALLATQRVVAPEHTAAPALPAHQVLARALQPAPRTPRITLKSFDTEVSRVASEASRASAPRATGPRPTLKRFTSTSSKGH